MNPVRSISDNGYGSDISEFSNSRYVRSQTRPNLNRPSFVPHLMNSQGLITVIYGDYICSK